MRNALFIFSALFLLSLSACKDPNKSVYEGCCGTEPTMDEFLITMPLPDENGNMVDSTMKSRVYIPNVFIIDASGENNFLNVFGSPTVKQIVSLVFSDDSGNSLFSRSNIYPNDPGAGGWNGLKQDGSFYLGSFNYDVDVEFINGQIKHYHGKSCAFKCDDEGFPQDNIPQCAFPSQHDGSGGFDPTLPGSSHCF